VRGDRYILRRPSPGETIGGGMIVDHQPKGRHKRFDEDVLKSLESLIKGSPADILFEAALAAGIAPIREMITRSRLEKESANEALAELIKGRLVILEGGVVSISSDALAAAQPIWETTQEKMVELVSGYHKQFPYRRGIPREELKSKLKLAARVFNAVTAYCVSQNIIMEAGSSLAMPGHTIQFNGQDQDKIHALMRAFEQNPFGPPGVKECVGAVGEEIFRALLESNELTSVSSDVVFRKKDYDELKRIIRGLLTEKGKITLAEVRDTLGTTRKYVQALLEHLDSTGFTIRDGDFRRPGRT
jgi:selenocysteine-specific elongation factor